MKRQEIRCRFWPYRFRPTARGKKSEQPKSKRFRTSAPKGAKLAEGYNDRTRDRTAAEEDDRASRLKALEECLKKEEIDQATYEKLRFQIAGGDLSSTHLVKGLDFKLLERIRSGEDVNAGETSKKLSELDDVPEDEPEGLDDELERMEETAVQAVAKKKTQKKGQLATTLPAAGKKRTRDQVLAEMKAARQAAKEKEASSLSTKFKKIGEIKKAGSRIERDSKGREVLIIVDEDGHEKRKVRKVAVDASKEREAFIPDKEAEVLGMEVPDFYKQKKAKEAEEEAAKEVSIFDDAGSDYDPLAGLDSASEAPDSEGEVSESEAKESKSPEKEDGEVASGPPPGAMAPPPRPQASSGARNYFKDSKSALASEESRNVTSLSDPAVLAALRKAKQLNAAVKTEEEQKNADREQRLKELLQSSIRDDEDMDLGFGTNRLEDEEDLEENHVKLSAWGDEGDGEHGGGKAKRKRGPKKRKGDGNNPADVMRVLERRKTEGS